MKKFIAVLVMCLMLAGIMAAPAFAAAVKDVVVSGMEYYPSGALKSLTVEFNWDTSSNCAGRIVLMTERLRSAGEPGTDSDYGDFTDYGYYGSDFSSFDAVLSHDNANHTFGILDYTDEKEKPIGNIPYTMTFELEDNQLILNGTKTLYMYLWTQYWGFCYPDSLVCAIVVRNGQVGFAPVDDTNGFDDDSLQGVGGEPLLPFVAETPATGDGMNLALWISLLCVSAAGIVFIGRKSKKYY